MKRYLNAILAIFALTGLALAQSMKEALAPFIDSGELPGAISILVSGDREQIELMGWADRENKIPLTMDSPFMQCSQTKGFCGVTVAILVEEGRLGLDDPIADYLPAFSNMLVRVREADGSQRLVAAATPITVRMCMNHTAGFEFEIPTKVNKGWKAISLQDTALEAAAQPLRFEPGSGVKYSNTGIDIAAAVVEKVTGEPWDVFLKKRVLDPLEMKETTFWPTDEMLARRIKLCCAVRGASAREDLNNRSMPPPFNGPSVYPSAGAGLWTSANDQIKFYKMLMNLGVGENGARILKEETVKNLLATSTRDGTRFKEGYSLGLNVKDDGWFGHGGAWNTDASVNPEKRQMRIWIIQISGNPRPWESARNAAVGRFFGKSEPKDDGAYTGRLE